MARVTPEELDYIRTAAIGDMLGRAQQLVHLLVVFAPRGGEPLIVPVEGGAAL